MFEQWQLGASGECAKCVAAGDEAIESKGERSSKKERTSWSQSMWSSGLV